MGVTHQIVITPQEAPRCFEIRCLGCHDVTWTPWGEAHAVEIGEMHLWAMKGQGARMLPSGTDPAKNALDPFHREKLPSERREIRRRRAHG